MLPIPTSGQTAAQPNARRQVYLTLGNLCLFAGLYLLLYVGGLYAEVDYQRMAARGDNDLAVPLQRNSGFVRPASEPPVAQADGQLPAWSVLVLGAAGQSAATPPDDLRAAHAASVERIVIPSVGLDFKVIEVGWESVEQNGQQLAVWQVAEYAVGQHQGSANPGEGGNVVLAGHVGGYGQVFRDLPYVRPGEQVVLYSGGQQFLYRIEERLVLDEEGASATQRAANAALIGPTAAEMVTMVTCWPPNGPDKFTQRIVVRAVPYVASAPPADTLAPQTAR